LSEPWLGAAFLIVSFFIAQVSVVIMHVQTTRMWADISEVQLARDLYLPAMTPRRCRMAKRLSRVRTAQMMRL